MLALKGHWKQYLSNASVSFLCLLCGSPLLCLALPTYVTEFKFSPVDDTQDTVQQIAVWLNSFMSITIYTQNVTVSPLDSQA